MRETLGNEELCGCVTTAGPQHHLPSSAVMEVTFVKADGPGEQDRVYLTMGGAVRRGPVHVVHDLPHLVVESVFGIEDGLSAELEASRHAATARAVTARDPKRQKTGRIVSRAAEGVSASRWLTAGAQAGQGSHQCRASRSSRSKRPQPPRAETEDVLCHPRRGGCCQGLVDRF